MLTLREALQLPSLSSFRLVAGASGLDRIIKEVNVLDHEYTEPLSGPIKRDNLFQNGALVLASLLYARNNPERILPVVKQLVADHCCAVAVKTIYYDKLPAEVIDYANSISLPIFLFEKTDFENIIYEVFKAVYQENRILYLEKTINRIVDESCPSDEKLRFVKELIPALDVPFKCDYYKPREPLDLLEYEQLINHLWKSNSPSIHYFPYKNGVLLISENKYRTLAIDRVLCTPNYYHGISEDFFKYEDIPCAIAESLCASEFAERELLKEAHFSGLGIMQFLLPNQGNYWLNKFCTNMRSRLTSANKGKDLELYDTIRTYVEENFDIAATAEKLSFHKNTVRYRIQKAKEILGYDENTSDFHQAIYLMITYLKL